MNRTNVKDKYIGREIYKLIPNAVESFHEIVKGLFKSGNENNPAILFQLNSCIDCVCNKKYDKVKILGEQILDFTWEMLHTGHWKDVKEDWRIIYSLASLFKILSISTDQEINEIVLKEVFRLCDMALVMGVPILDDIFNKIIELCKPTNQEKRTSSHENEFARKKKICVNTTDKIDQIRIRKGHNVPILNCPSLQKFKINFWDLHNPVVLDNCINHWPALSLWDFDYLVKIAGHRTVPVEIGSKYTDDEWGQKLMTINEFVDQYVDSCSNGIGYIAQHRLFDQVPQLREDISIPDYCCLSKEPDFSPDDGVDVNAWFGPQGTVSPCHQDPKHNLLAQITGRKYVKLYPCDQAKCLYPHEGIISNTSQVDVEQPDTDKHPLFADMDAMHGQEHVLLPGQVLYIPPKHWHYVRSLDQSFSVSFWWE